MRVLPNRNKLVVLKKFELKVNHKFKTLLHQTALDTHTGKYPNHSLSRTREQESGTILPIAPKALQQVDGTPQCLTGNTQ